MRNRRNENEKEESCSCRLRRLLPAGLLLPVPELDDVLRDRFDFDERLFDHVLFDDRHDQFFEFLIFIFYFFYYYYYSFFFLFQQLFFQLREGTDVLRGLRRKGHALRR